MTSVKELYFIWFYNIFSILGLLAVIYVDYFLGHFKNTVDYSLVVIKLFYRHLFIYFLVVVALSRVF